jgi:hypothetical protein
LKRARKALKEKETELVRIDVALADLKKTFDASLAENPVLHHKFMKHKGSFNVLLYYQ